MKIVMGRPAISHGLIRWARVNNCCWPYTRRQDRLCETGDIMTTASSFDTIRAFPSDVARGVIRQGGYTRHTAGLAAGCLQANLVVLPQDVAGDFARFCALNPKPCPVVGQTTPGDPMFRNLGQDIDLRTDIPSYNIYRDGVLTDQTTDLRSLWRDDLVGFALGCSFTFENVMIRAGLPVWHIANNTTVPMFRTSIDLAPAGPFQGKMVVSMRAFAPDQVPQASEISARFPWAHGAPVHCGDPADIGIIDITRPDWGDPASVGPGQVPCFWACGVTPQSVVIDARLPFVVTHTPGHMLITDVPEDQDARVIS